MIPTELLAALRGSRRVLVLSHVAPDGDAVGSLLGMGRILRALGKQVTEALQDRIPTQFAGLPGAGAIAGPGTLGGVGAGYDTVVAVDCSSPDRMGRAYPERLAGLPLAVVDHHVTNPGFGTANWVEPAAAATCEMLVELADALGVTIDPTLALLLLTGIVTDTLSFRTASTTPEALAAAMRLMRAGASLVEITEGMLERRSLAVVRLWGRVLGGAQMEEGVIWTVNTLAEQAAAGVEGNEDGSLSSMLIRTIGCDVSATFTEKMDESGEQAVECSFRARRGFDVSGVALALGGGGHPGASGCTVRGAPAAIAAAVVPMLQQARREQADARAAAATNPGLSAPVST
jgi:phosphoesterase RecJ-like protein